MFKKYLLIIIGTICVENNITRHTMHQYVFYELCNNKIDYCFDLSLP